MSATQEVLKESCTWFQSWQGTRPAHPGTWWETHPSMPLKPRLRTSILFVEPTVALRLRFRLTQLWSRLIPAHTGVHPVTRQQPFPGTCWEVTQATHLVIGPLSENPVVDPEEDPCPRATPLNKGLEAIPSTRHQTGSMPIQVPGNTPVNCRPHCIYILQYPHNRL